MQRPGASRSQSPQRHALACGPGDGLGFAAVDALRPTCIAAASAPHASHSQSHASLRNARQPTPSAPARALSCSRLFQPSSPLAPMHDVRLAEVRPARDGGGATWACDAHASSDVVVLCADLKQVCLSPLWQCIFATLPCILRLGLLHV